MKKVEEVKEELKAKPTIKKVGPGAVTLTAGALAGMVFEVEDFTPVTYGEQRIKYAAPNGGPRAVVTYHSMKESLRAAYEREAVRTAFSHLIPSSVAWNKETGYSDRTSGTAIAWDHALARFVPKV